MQNLLKKFTGHPKMLLLTDGIGALFSAFMLGIVLVHLQRYFGMPPHILRFLGGLAALYAGYSFTVYFTARQVFSWHFYIIAAANLTHCFLTLGLLCKFQNEITLFAWLYFIGEISIVLFLVYLEFKVANALVKN